MLIDFEISNTKQWTRFWCIGNLLSISSNFWFGISLLLQSCCFELRTQFFKLLSKFICCFLQNIKITDSNWTRSAKFITIFKKLFFLNLLSICTSFSMCVVNFRFVSIVSPCNTSESVDIILHHGYKEY